MSVPTNEKKSDLDSLLENIDKQLLLNLLDSLIAEQSITQENNSTQE